MTREEAAKILYQEKSSAGWMRWVGFPIDIKKEQDYKRFILAVDVALDALCGPDPDTGLMPCGCGGKAEIGQYCEVTCDKCGASVPANYTEADAKAAWNRAMGYTAPAPAGCNRA